MEQSKVQCMEQSTDQPMEQSNFTDTKQSVLSLYLSPDPMSLRQIARNLGISLRTVRYHINKHKQVNETASKKQPKSKLEIMRNKRKDPSFQAKEAESMRRYRKRKKLEHLGHDIKRFKRDFDLNASAMNPNFKKIADKFFEAVADGPIHDCICCDRLWFKSSMRMLSKNTLISKGASQEFLKLAFKTDINDTGQVCKTCYDSLMNLKIPESAVSNGFKFPDIPDCLSDLTLLEERLVACRLPFMQIYPVRGCQYKIKGSVVNVPIKLDSTVNQLPRNLDDSHTVHVKLKRRLTFKSDYMYEIINPQKVFKAAEYLMQQELYQNFDVGLNMDWYQNFQEKKFGLWH